jgi:predicted esterase
LFLVGGWSPASALSINDCGAPQSGKAEVIAIPIDPRHDADKNDGADACPQKGQIMSKSPVKAAPINIITTGSGTILKKPVKGNVLPQTEDALHEDLAFKYRIYRPKAPNGDTMVLLHGSGQDETSLVSFASKIAPNSVLLAVRGRVVQDGTTRWYRRLTPVSFDQKDIHSEAKAFAGFLKKVTVEYKINPDRVTFLGYSNGANLANALMMLYPDLVKQAVLLRSMPVLDETTEANLTNARVLTVSGASDQLYSPFGPALADLLRSHGAHVEARLIKSDHGLSKDDVKVVGEWLAGGATATAQLKKN